MWAKLCSNAKSLETRQDVLNQGFADAEWRKGPGSEYLTPNPPCHLKPFYERAAQCQILLKTLPTAGDIFQFCICLLLESPQQSKQWHGWWVRSVFEWHTAIIFKRHCYRHNHILLRVVAFFVEPGFCWKIQLYWLIIWSMSCICHFSHLTSLLIFHKLNKCQH